MNEGSRGPDQKEMTMGMDFNHPFPTGINGKSRRKVDKDNGGIRFQDCSQSFIWEDVDNQDLPVVPINWNFNKSRASHSN
jgi:hypothetical protein